MRGISKTLAGIALLAAASACELKKTVIADAQDVVIVESVLHGGDSIQFAFLHRTFTGGDATVPGASVVITEAATGAQLRLLPATDSLCLRPFPTPDAPKGGSCYFAKVSPTLIKPGSRYTLRIDLPDQRVLTGVTDVPGAFTVTRPASGGAARTTCRIDPKQTFDLTWTHSSKASVYISEARFPNLRQALRDEGTTVEGDGSIDLTGLSISAEDTTLAFPGDLGIFDRFDTSVFDVLIAIRNGLPANVDATVVISAADRNYVNWIRGGNFNPSGPIHIGSISGDGDGVFGSLVSRTVLISTRQSSRQPCS